MLSVVVVDSFWIDKETFVPLKVEQNYGPKGTSIYEVTSVSYDVTLPDSLFQYVPPPNAQVLAGPADIKKTLAK